MIDEKIAIMLVFSAYAEVVPTPARHQDATPGILRVRGGSSWDGAEDFSDDLHSPRTRR